MKKPNRSATFDRRRRRLLLALGLSAGSPPLWAAGGCRKDQRRLLSLREADFYHRHDLAG